MSDANGSGDEWAAALTEGIMWDHIGYVEHGVRPVDNDYYSSRQKLIEKYGIADYNRRRLDDEQRITELHNPKWQSMRIPIPETPPNDA